MGPDGQDDEGEAPGGCATLLVAAALAVPGVFVAAEVSGQASGSEQVDLLDDALVALVLSSVLVPGSFLVASVARVRWAMCVTVTGLAAIVAVLAAVLVSIVGIGV